MHNYFHSISSEICSCFHSIKQELYQEQEQEQEQDREMGDKTRYE